MGQRFKRGVILHKTKLTWENIFVTTFNNTNFNISLFDLKKMFGCKTKGKKINFLQSLKIKINLPVERWGLLMHFLQLNEDMKVDKNMQKI